MHILWCRTGICSWEFSAKVSLMLDYFQFHLFVNSTISGFASSRLAWKWPANRLFPLGKAMSFWSDARCFGPIGKSRHYIKISIKTVRVSRLFFGFLWLCFQHEKNLKNWLGSFLKDQRRIWNPVGHLRWSLFAKIINGLTVFYFHIKIFIVDVRLGSKYASEYYLIYAWDND